MMLMRGSPALCRRKISRAGLGSPGHCGEGVDIDADRKHSDGKRFAVHGEDIGRHQLATHEVANETAEMPEIGFGLKADQIIFEERVQQPLVLRDRHQHIWSRKGDVQEKTNLIGDLTRAQARSKRDEMIVLHPDEVVGLQQGHEHLRKAVVDAPVAVGALLREAGEIEPVMMHRP